MAAHYTTEDDALVGVIMGSATDWPTMKSTSEVLDLMGIVHECNVISAHRAPDRLVEYCGSVETRGLKILICAAGGAAHLAGVVAAHTHLPVIGCPMQAWSLDGLDSLLSMAQMPKGVPVGTMAVGKAGAINAALYAAAIIGLSDDAVRARLLEYRQDQSQRIDTLSP